MRGSVVLCPLQPAAGQSCSATGDAASPDIGIQRTGGRGQGGWGRAGGSGGHHSACGCSDGRMLLATHCRTVCCAGVTWPTPACRGWSQTTSRPTNRPSWSCSSWHSTTAHGTLVTRWVTSPPLPCPTPPPPTCKGRLCPHSPWSR